MRLSLQPKGCFQGQSTHSLAGSCLLHSGMWCSSLFGLLWDTSKVNFLGLFVSWGWILDLSSSCLWGVPLLAQDIYFPSFLSFPLSSPTLSEREKTLCLSLSNSLSSGSAPIRVWLWRVKTETPSKSFATWNNLNTKTINPWNTVFKGKNNLETPTYSLNHLSMYAFI